MASFSAFLSVGGGFETWINSFVLDVHQRIDELGRPASPTQGSRLTLAFDATRNPLVTAWMINPIKQHSGSVTFYDRDGLILKTINFINAFCVDQHESFAGTGQEGQMETTIVISAEKITVGTIPHDNDWPDTETS